MAELFMPGMFTDLTDEKQLGILNQLLQSIVEEARPAGTGIRRTDFIRKTTAQTINNSSTLQNDDQLFAPLAANERVVFFATIRHVGNATADIKFTFTGPSGSSGSHVFPNAYIDTGDTLGTPLPQGFTGTSSVAGASGARVQLIIGLATTGATAGNLQFQWAQNTATAVDTTVQVDSSLLIWRI